MKSKKKLLKINKVLVKGCKRLVRENSNLRRTCVSLREYAEQERARVAYLADYVPKDADGCFTMPDGDCISNGECPHHTVEMVELPGPFADPAVDAQDKHWCVEHNQQRLFCSNEPHKPTHVINGHVTVIENGVTFDGALLDGRSITATDNHFAPDNSFVGVPDEVRSAPIHGTD